MKIIFQTDEGETIREEIIDTEDEASMLTDMIDVTEWITNALREKARRVTDRIVEKSGMGSKYTDSSAKKQIISTLRAEGHALMKSVKQKNEERETERALKRQGENK